MTFKVGECCEKINNFGDLCPQKIVTSIPNTNIFYCKFHFKAGLKNYKLLEKKKILQIIMAAKKEKENKIIEKKKLLDDINLKREANGLPLLKRIPKITKKQNIENIVEKQNNSIELYKPDEIQICTAILKYGSKKGFMCGCKKIEINGFCKRHNTKNQNEEDVNVK
jgi:hypothetical protein